MILWTPEEQVKTQQKSLMDSINHTYDTNLKTAEELYEWSVKNTASFWEQVWQDCDIIHSKPYMSVIDDPKKMPGARWFEGAKLNFAENCLRYRDDHIALKFNGEGKIHKTLTYKALFDQVEKVAGFLKEKGVKVGDRVAGVVANTPEAVVAMLATSSLGAIWSSCSPDFGTEGILNRLKQVEPKILFATKAYYYKGKVVCCRDNITSVLGQCQSIESTIWVDYAPSESEIEGDHFSDILETPSTPPLQFEQLPFDHPLYILFSSGTTGMPKCIVHGQGGTLIQHLKEHKYHCNLKRSEQLLYFTTCGWMMWNWLVSGLALGATIVLYDGSPFSPSKQALWQYVIDEKIALFGTSAKFIAASQTFRIKPKELGDLETCRLILSTGSPLSEEGFDYIHQEAGTHIQLASISGGTDIVSCFLLGNPDMPVRKGELQCRGLGMDVKAFNDQGQSVTNEKGELVCCTAFPSMPIYFWNDPDNSRYKKSYFSQYENIWCHGDYITLTSNGGAVVWGRSDATLNPGGVRIGTAEIYKVIEGLTFIEDSIVVGLQSKGDEKIVLFLKAEDPLSVDQLKTIKTSIREQCTPRHVPSIIKQVKDIPYTASGKKVELAVKALIHGNPVNNKSALANPDSLKEFSKL